jgi:N-acetylglucosamine-6-phosphate deacetylase
VAATKGSVATVLITDAMAAAGQPDGRYALGSLDVDVTDGVATLVDGDALAGSTLTMDAAVRNAVSWGIPIETASAAASGTPARLLGLDDRTGAIEAGKRADLVVLDESLHVDAVVVAGEVVHGTLMDGVA